MIRTQSPPRRFLSAHWLSLSALLGLCCEPERPHDSVAPDAPQHAHTAQAQVEAPPDSVGETPPTEASPAEVPPSDDVDEPGKALETPASPRVEPKPHPGPFLWVTRSSAAVYSETKADRERKIGYVKRGGQVPILEGKVEGEDCPKGWFRVPSGGFICSQVGTTDADHKDVKYRPRQPNLDDILPYLYARNRENGTALYKTVPTKEQTLAYEPYLPEAKKRREEEARKAEEERSRREALARRMEEDRRQMEEAGLEVEMPDLSSPVVAASTQPTGPADPDESADAPGIDVPLWEREENLHEVTLEDLRKESDDILAARLMKGFYVAVDRTIKWDGRAWYKTTKGYITPADRFYQTEGSDFRGVELDGEQWSLPVGWVAGPRKNAPTYEIDTATNQRKPKGQKANFEAVALRYRYHRIGDVEYFQMADGDFIRDAHVRMTTPGPRPPEVGEHERWIDIDISEQTLVVFEGDRPVYATLLSSGRHSKIKDKDHSTPRGMWRVREKHIVATMDGDGSAAGDLPYSIEDVPYIMYFHKSYATHGAFWHRNYGFQMSHGCINLAPLDAKWIFFYADPPVPEGLHGVWSHDESPGSMVVVHD